MFLRLYVYVCVCECSCERACIYIWTDKYERVDILILAYVQSTARRLFSPLILLFSSDMFGCRRIEQILHYKFGKVLYTFSFLDIPSRVFFTLWVKQEQAIFRTLYNFQMSRFKISSFQFLSLIKLRSSNLPHSREQIHIITRPIAVHLYQS